MFPADLMGALVGHDWQLTRRNVFLKRKEARLCCASP